jgi:hypothetical protein
LQPPLGLKGCDLVPQESQACAGARLFTESPEHYFLPGLFRNARFLGSAREILMAIVARFAAAWGRKKWCVD